MAEVNRIKLADTLNPAEIANLFEWEAVVPITDYDLPKFPIGCLPDILRKQVQSVAEATQTPDGMSAVACLAVMSLCVHGKYIIQGKKDWYEPLNLYVVIVMRSGERKSQVFRLAMQPIEKYMIEENKRLKSEIERNKLDRALLVEKIEILKRKASDNTEKLNLLYEKQDELTAFEDLKPYRLTTDDVSPEALVSLLADNNGRIALVSPEGGIFETIMGRYSNTPNLDVFLKGHSGDTLRVDRKGRKSEFVESPALTILLMVQPDVLDGLMNNDLFRGRGLTSRFLFSCPESKVGRRKFNTEPISEGCSDAYRGLCESLLALSKDENEKVLRLSTEAYEFSAKFAEELEPRLIGI